MKKVLKNKIIFIAIFLIGMMSMLTFCSSEQMDWPIMTMNVGQEDEIGGKTVYDFQWPYYDYLFAEKDIDENKEIWNDLYVYTSYAYNYDNVYAIKSIKKNEAEGRIEITIQVISNDSLGTYIQVDKKALFIEQEILNIEEEGGEGEEDVVSDDLVNEDGQEEESAPRFACIGGEGLIDFNGRAYTGAKGYPPFRIEKEKFLELLEKANPTEKNLLLHMYETGLPRKVEWFRFRRQFLEELESEKRFDDLEFLKSMYFQVKGEPTSFYLKKVRTEEERERLLDILASCENTWSVLAPSLKEWSQEDYQKPNSFNYRDYYISKFDLISNPFYDSIGYYGISRDDNKKIQNFLFEHDMFKPKEFTLYFSNKSKEGDAIFNIDHPFDIRNNCVECFNYKDVWLKEKESEEEPEEEIVNDEENIIEDNEDDMPNEIPNDPPNDPDNNNDDNPNNEPNNDEPAE